LISKSNRGVPPPTAEYSVSRGDGKPLFTIYIITHNTFFSTKKSKMMEYSNVKVLSRYRSFTIARF